MRRAARGLLALVILGPVVLGGALLAACGVEWFPKCTDPHHPCPPMPEPQPFPMAAHDAGDDRG